MSFLLKDLLKILTESPGTDTDSDNTVVHARKKSDSLDDQIDSLLLGYEKDAVVSDDDIETQVESLSIRKTLPFLFEAPGDDEEEDDEDKKSSADDDAADIFDDDIAPGQDDDKLASQKKGDEGGDDMSAESDPSFVDSSKNSVNSPEAQKKIPIDVDIFAQKVSRLIDNFDSLLDIIPVIINRSAKILRENHGEDSVEKFKEIMSSDYDVDIEPKDNKPQRPIAAGAGPMGA